MIRILFMFLIFAPATSMAQHHLEGNWEGTITRDMYPGSEIFDFTLLIKEEDGAISGKSIVKGFGMFGVMEIEGKIENNSIFFNEVKITNRERPEAQEWCLKNAWLKVEGQGNDLILRGFWKGKTSFMDCSPGKIVLKRAVPRA